ncbi:MAG: hypothetical protein QOK22_1867 [Gaiellaceae bacterium]|jgi:hypothetical protein|nr:hypothetical protein [Gaiellaceae bacterium]
MDEDFKPTFAPESPGLARCSPAAEAAECAAETADCACPDFCERDHANE